MTEGKGVIAINIETGERKEYASINAAARDLRSNFATIQKSIIRNGITKGWRIYPTAENIRRQIDNLEEMLKVVEG